MKALLVAFAYMLVAPLASYSAMVDLSDWHLDGNDSDWQPAPDKNSVLQMINGRPSVFFDADFGHRKMLKGTIAVETGSDDDFIGFVLGYRDGYQQAVAQGESYVLIDWKQATQENSRGSVAKEGMAASLVTAPVSGGDNAWGHMANAGVTELARATTLGSTGWQDYQLYEFALKFWEDRIQVFVDGRKELDVTGSFPDAGVGFYNYSQLNVRYAELVQLDLSPAPVPLPAGLPLMVGTLGGLSLIRRNRKTSTRARSRPRRHT